MGLRSVKGCNCSVNDAIEANDTLNVLLIPSATQMWEVVCRPCCGKSSVPAFLVAPKQFVDHGVKLHHPAVLAEIILGLAQEHIGAPVTPSQLDLARFLSRPWSICMYIARQQPCHILTMILQILRDRKMPKLSKMIPL